MRLRNRTSQVRAGVCLRPVISPASIAALNASPRRLTSEEKTLVECLLKDVNPDSFVPISIDFVMVEEMNDADTLGFPGGYR